MNSCHGRVICANYFVRWSHTKIHFKFCVFLDLFVVTRNMWDLLEKQADQLKCQKKLQGRPSEVGWLIFPREPRQNALTKKKLELDFSITGFFWSTVKEWKVGVRGILVWADCGPHFCNERRIRKLLGRHYHCFRSMLNFSHDIWSIVEPLLQTFKLDEQLKPEQECLVTLRSVRNRKTIADGATTCFIFTPIRKWVIELHEFDSLSIWENYSRREV